MSFRRVIRAAAVGCALCLGVAGPGAALAQGVLRIMKGATSDSVVVDLNRAVVVESRREFTDVTVANPAIADVDVLGNQTIYILGRAPGRTTLTLFGPGGQVITSVDIRVSPDLAEFKDRLREILPGEKIEVRTANDGIVLSGRVSGAAKIDRAMELAERYAPDKVTNLMQVGGTQQVMLKVRFAEMQRSTAKSLGVSIGINTLIGNFNARGESGTFLAADNGPGQPFETAADTFGALIGGFAAGSAIVDIAIEALEDKGLVRTLAEPNLIALSGDEAQFLAGGEFPIPVPTDTGNIAIEYKPFGVGLTFRPRVIDDDLINMQLEAFVSAVDSTQTINIGGTTAPAFSVRRARTTVELRDGQSFAIAGLLQDNFNDLSSQIPWLGDIPVLGTLFRSTNFQRRQSELVVIVTPHLVVPTDGDTLSLPTDRIRLPNEAELFLLGNIEGTSPASEVARQGFEGNYGYVSE